MFNEIGNIPISFEQLSQNILTDSRFMRVKVWVCNIGENKNGSYFSKEVLIQMASTLQGVPIVGYIDKNKYNNIDFRAHEEQLIFKDNEYQFEYLGFAYGFIPNDNNVKFESKVGTDGLEHVYLTTEGLIWTKWKDVINIFERNNYKKNHSMELLKPSIEGYFDKNDNLYHFTKATFDALCVLGSDIQSAVDSSTIHKFSYVDIKSQITYMINEYNSSNSQIERSFLHPLSEDLNFYNEKNILPLLNYTTPKGVDIATINKNLLDKEEDLVAKNNKDNIVNANVKTIVGTKTDFALTSKQIIAIIEVETDKIKNTSENSNCECYRYWVQDFDDTYVYVKDLVENVYKRMPYTIDNMIAFIDFESAEIVIKGGYKIVGEVSNDENPDGAVENSSPNYQNMYEKMKVDYELIQAKYEKMKVDYELIQAKYETSQSDLANVKLKMEDIESKLVSLERYKFEKEKEEKESVFNQFSFHLTEEEIKPIRQNSDKYTINEIENYLYSLIGKKNFSLNKNSNKNPIISMGLDIDANAAIENTSGKSYDDILKKYTK